MKEDSRRFQLRPGKRLDIPDKAKDVSDSLTPTGRKWRTKIDRRLKNGFVNPSNENITTGTAVGATITAIVWALEDYLPARSGANTEVTNVEREDGKATYTINTNAPLESQARFRSILDSTTGITSLWTDDIEVKDFEVVNKRPSRDTYRYEITVKDS